MDVVITALALVAVVLLITRLHVNAVISLLLGATLIGLATGQGVGGTVDAIVEGFGDIMSRVGLLIGFGVLIGSMLLALGTLERCAELLVRVLGPRRLPYTLAAMQSAVFPSIYGDVQLVLAAPLARSAAPKLGVDGLGVMAGALTAGILCGYAFVVPSLVTVTISGLVGASLITMLGYGLIVGPLTAALTVLIWRRLLRMGFWNSGGDEAPAAEDVDEPAKTVAPLALSLLAVILPLILIAAGTVTAALGVESPVLAALGHPAAALFLGLCGAYLLGRRCLGRQQTDQALSRGFDVLGHLLLVTGVGGSLGAVINQTELTDVLKSLFAADAGATVVTVVLLAWLIAAVLHLAVGSITVAAVTACTTLAPVIGQLPISAAVVALAVSAGAIFAVTVHSNFFWMFQTLLGVTTRGALKALTLVSAIASVVAVPLVLVLSLIA